MPQADGYEPPVLRNQRPPPLDRTARRGKAGEDDGAKIGAAEAREAEAGKIGGGCDMPRGRASTGGGQGRKVRGDVATSGGPTEAAMAALVKRHAGNDVSAEGVWGGGVKVERLSHPLTREHRRRPGDNEGVVLRPPRGSKHSPVASSITNRPRRRRYNHHGVKNAQVRRHIRPHQAQGQAIHRRNGKEDPREGQPGRHGVQVQGHPGRLPRRGAVHLKTAPRRRRGGTHREPPQLLKRGTAATCGARWRRGAAERCAGSCRA